MPQLQVATTPDLAVICAEFVRLVCMDLNASSALTAEQRLSIAEFFVSRYGMEIRHVQQRQGPLDHPWFPVFNRDPYDDGRAIAWLWCFPNELITNFEIAQMRNRISQGPDAIPFDHHGWRLFQAAAAAPTPAAPTPAPPTDTSAELWKPEVPVSSPAVMRRFEIMAWVDLDKDFEGMAHWVVRCSESARTVRSSRFDKDDTAERYAVLRSELPKLASEVIATEVAKFGRETVTEWARSQ